MKMIEDYEMISASDPMTAASEHHQDMQFLRVINSSGNASSTAVNTKLGRLQ